MKKIGNHKAGALSRALLLCIGAALSACTSAGTNSIDDTLSVSPQQAALPKPDPIQDPRAFCPKTVLRAGTETYDIYPDGIDDRNAAAASELRWRATITEVARECNTAGSFLNIRVGVRGRYLSGPKGETGAFVMPVRIAVTRGEEVLYTKLHQIPAEIPVGRRNGTFAYVDNAISIPKPDKENVRIFVGFDEGPAETQ